MIQYRTKDRSLRMTLETLDSHIEDLKESFAKLSEYLNQAVKTNSSPTFNTVKLSALSDNYVPYHISDNVGLANSPIYTDGTKVSIGTTYLFCKLNVHGAGLFRLHDNLTEAELLVFQDLNGNWLGSINGYIVSGANGFLKFYDYYGGSWNAGLFHKGGAIGIGQAPDYANYKLDVYGNTRVSGNLIWNYANRKARAYRSGNQSTTNATWIQVQLNAETYDPDNCFDSSNNYCYNVPHSGYYLVLAQVTFGSIQAGRYMISVNDGTDRVLNERQLQTVSNYETLAINDIIYFNANSQVKLYAYQNTGGNTPVIYGGTVRTYLTITPIL